jgi:NAD(P)-dependent dehydrogenase (short-subunit alcohol dehydrogenase family)
MPMDGKRVVITGATSGIGKAAARELVRRGATVGIVGRNQAKTEAAAEELGAADVFIADLAELEDVRAVAADIAGRWPGVDVLVNNAGMNTISPARTSGGLEPMSVTNLLAPFLLTTLLHDALAAAAPARVVNVASEAHRLASPLDPSAIASWPIPTNGLQLNRDYGRTKLALLLAMQELAERWKGDGIDVNNCCPGLVATNLAGDDSPFTHASKLLSRTPLVRRPEQGAAVVVRLACDPAMTGRTGEFHSSTPGGSLLPPTPRRRDRALQTATYEAVSALVTSPPTPTGG